MFLGILTGFLPDVLKGGLDFIQARRRVDRIFVRERRWGGGGGGKRRFSKLGGKKLF